MSAPILETSALVAYFEDGNGAQEMQLLLEKATRRDALLLMSDVNYAELKQIIIRKHGEAAWNRVMSSLDSLPIEFLPTTKSVAETAASLAERHRISLATAFAVSLAKEKKAELVTGNEDLKRVAAEIKIRCLRK